MGDALVSADAIADPPPFLRARSAVLYDDLARAIVHRLKYKDRTDLAVVMARWMARAGNELVAQSDCVLSIPLHRRRLLARRYNQSAELARAIAKQSGLPYLPEVLIRKKATRQQVGLGANARAENVRGAFTIPDAAKPSIMGRAALLIDDVYTTGATVKAASRSLLRAGAGSVSVLTFARVAPGPL
jgi:ComF family protein